MAAVTVTPTARDISLEFTDSCNCCWNWCRPKPRDDDPVYVTHEAALERFKRVPRPSISHQTSHRRVQEVVRARLHSATRDIAYAEMRLQELADYDFDAELHGSRPMTLGKIKRINAAIDSVLREIAAEPSPKRVDGGVA